MHHLHKVHRRLTGDLLLRARVLTKLERMVRAEAAKAGLPITRVQMGRYYDPEHTLLSVLRVIMANNSASEILEFWDSLPYADFAAELRRHEARTFQRHVAIQVDPFA